MNEVKKKIDQMLKNIKSGDASVSELIDYIKASMNDASFDQKANILANIFKEHPTSVVSKILEVDFYPDDEYIKLAIAKTGNKSLIKKLLKLDYMGWSLESTIVGTNDDELIAMLIERKDLTWWTEAYIAGTTTNREVVLKLLDKDNLCEEAQAAIAQNFACDNVVFFKFLCRPDLHRDMILILAANYRYQVTGNATIEGVPVHIDN